MKSCLGNDIVDLSRRRINEKVNDSRFIKRVFSTNERSLIYNSSLPLITLWKIWAAKESVYKISSKMQENLYLNFQKIEINLEEATGSLNGHDYFLSWEINHSFVHCIATTDLNSSYRYHVYKKEDIEETAAILSENERLFALSSESLKARLIAKEFLKQNFGICNAEIYRHLAENNNFLPPTVRVNGNVTNIDISLSHDGKYIAIGATRSEGEEFYNCP